MFALARIICGIGFVVTTIYFTKMVADWFDGKELATAMAVLVMSWPFGIAMGQVGHVWLAALFDWRMAFVAASIYCCLGALGVFSVYRMPTHANDNTHSPQLGLPGNDPTLTLLASLVWERWEEHTSELQYQASSVCGLMLKKKKQYQCIYSC